MSAETSKGQNSPNSLADEKQVTSTNQEYLKPESISSDWQVQEGAMVGAQINPVAVGEYLKELNVVAEIDWFPNTPHLMGINVLRNASDGLAALDQAPDDFRVGVVLDELVSHLAKRFNADVRIGEHHENQLPDETALPALQSKEDVKVRVIEITDMPVSAVPFCAAANDITLGTMILSNKKRAIFYETTEDQIVDGSLISQIPALGIYVSDIEQRILAVTSEEAADPEALAIHSWTMQTQVVPGAVENVDNQLLARIRSALGHGNTPARIAALTEANEESLVSAFSANGPDGVVRALAALKLPPHAAAFLFGKLDLDQIEGVEIFHQPGWARAIGDSINLKLNYPDETPPGPLTSLAGFATRHRGLLQALNSLEGAVAVTLLGTSLLGKIKLKGLSKLSTLAASAMLLDVGLRYSLSRLTKSQQQDLDE